VDVGANIGVTVRLFAAQAGHVHAFEPAPRALRLLQRNVSDLCNVTLYTVALSNENGTARFSELEALDNSTLADDGIDVPVRTLDSYGLKPDVLKIDVEGFEHLVLEGARETLRHSPVVVFEAFGETARQYCENIIKSANPNYRFETMGGKTNHIAWPIK
jgi:FkbM family methyltransferase